MKKCRKLLQISIPKCCQQPRSGGAKRRTHYSDFLWSSPPAADNDRRPGSAFEFSSGKDHSSNPTIVSSNRCNHILTYSRKRRRPRLSQDQCSMAADGGKAGLLSFADIESVAQKALRDNFENGSMGIDGDEHIGGQSAGTICPLTPKDPELLHVMKTDHVLAAPGSVVWAKTAHHSWWPAEIMDERLESSSGRSVDGRVLVQLYGNHEYAWVDPVEDLSHFDKCFEERSCNPLNAFQDALKQALHKKSHINFCKQWDKRPEILVQCDQLPDKGNTASSSSRTEDDEVGGRGKRIRKPKLHFDEVTFSLKSIRKVRRLRIMRYLGLAAPPGSPFSNSFHVRNAAYKSCRVFSV